MTDQRLSILFRRYYQGTATPGEIAELQQGLDGPGGRELLEQLMQEQWEQLRQPDAQFAGYKKEEMWQQIMDRPLVPVHRIPRRRWWWAAAVLLIALGAGAYLWQGRGPSHDAPQQIAVTGSGIAAPRSTHAMITLGDGRQVLLDSMSNGTIASQGGTRLVKLQDGDIAYQPGTASTAAVTYNTLLVPRGSRVVHITLADGSQVWLNAASTLTYPAAFAGEERRVQISGEGYFEVAHNAAMPFLVQRGDMTVKVLGTHFNVDAYEEEAAAKVTLLKGSVEVGEPGRYTILKPGQQAEVSEGHIRTQADADIAAVMAWKNDRFAFNGQGIEDIMRQISRWYNVETAYRGPKPDVHFMGGMSRQQNVSEVLKMLEQTGAVHFEITGNKIVVTK